MRLFHLFEEMSRLPPLVNETSGCLLLKCQIAFLRWTVSLAEC